MINLLYGLCPACDPASWWDSAKRRQGCQIGTTHHGIRYHGSGNGIADWYVYPDLDALKALRLVSRRFRRVISIRQLLAWGPYQRLKQVGDFVDWSARDGLRNGKWVYQKVQITFGPTAQQSQLIRINSALASADLLCEVAIDHWDYLQEQFDIAINAEYFGPWDFTGYRYKKESWLPVDWIYGMTPFVHEHPLIIYQPWFKPPQWSDDIQRVQRGMNKRWDEPYSWNFSPPWNAPWYMVVTTKYRPCFGKKRYVALEKYIKK